jgi:hypothetical protein
MGTTPGPTTLRISLKIIVKACWCSARRAIWNPYIIVETGFCAQLQNNETNRRFVVSNITFVQANATTKNLKIAATNVARLLITRLELVNSTAMTPPSYPCPDLSSGTFL